MIKLIVAIAKNRVIGKDNDLIWHLPADMKYFSETTKGQIVLMGRKNWDSIPIKYRPLPSRLNLVVTRDNTFNAEGCKIYNSVELAIKAYSSDERDFFVIGGGQIYKYALSKNLIDEMYVTHIDESFEGDTYFPEIDETVWSKEIIFKHEKDDKNQYPFVVCKYSKTNLL